MDNDDDFPVDPTKHVLMFPTYMVQDETGKAVVCHTMTDGQRAIVLLTDEDSLNRYRHDIRLPERGAFKFNTARQLLAVLEQIPPEVRVYIDLMRTNQRE